MSKNATDICTILVDEVYGELTSRVFRELLCYGRLTFPGLLHHTRLTPRQLRHALTVLVQQHLIYWSTSTEDGVTSYEANEETSYMLVRSGKYIKFTEDRFGEVASGVVSNLLLLGHARIGDLEQAYKVARPTGAVVGLSNSQKKQPTNETKNRGPSLESLHLALSDLLQAGLVTIVNESHFRSDADNRTEAEREMPNPKAAAGKYKKEQEFDWERKIQQKLEDWKHGTKMERSKIAILPHGKKRSLEDPESNQDFKRLKTLLPFTKAAVGTAEHDLDTIIAGAGYMDPDLVLRINHDKFTVIARNHHFVELAEKCIGAATSKVYAEVLRKLEPQLRKCREELTSSEDPDEIDLSTLPQVSTQDLAAFLKDGSELAAAIGVVDSAKIDLRLTDHRKKERRKKSTDLDSVNDITVVGHVSSDENEDDYDSTNSDIQSEADSISSLSYSSPSKEINSLPPSNRAAMAALRQHLLLLCEHPHKFLHHVSRNATMPEKWAVNFSALSSTLLDVVLTQTISARFGPLATRLINILAAKGKLDEKTLTTLGLLNQKAMRALLTAMHQAGYLQLQEIPRDNNRQPSRTLFLWYWDAARAGARLLEESYAAMSRHVRRARVEREHVRETVEKATRTDVVGREDEFLGEGERHALGVWRAKEERLWGQVGKLDEIVAIVREF